MGLDWEPCGQNVGKNQRRSGALSLAARTIAGMRDSAELDWITDEVCPYCKTGVMCRYKWWLECSKCNGVMVDS